MRQIVLDGAAVFSREELHEVLSRELSLPEWYGRNLDALFDCLSAELTEETGIRVRHPEVLQERLGGYGTVFLRVLREAEEENPLLFVTLSE